jgi:hypothetical protein
MDTDPPIPIPTPLTKIKAQIIKSRYTDLQQLKTSALEHGETPNSSNTSQSHLLFLGHSYKTTPNLRLLPPKEAEPSRPETQAHTQGLA